MTGPTVAAGRAVLDRDAAEVLRDGDTLFVRPAGVFFVLGEVTLPGVYVVQPGMTVAQALSTAGGLTEDGSTRGIKISRLTGSKRVELGAEPTTVLTSSDIVRVRRRFFR